MLCLNTLSNSISGQCCKDANFVEQIKRLLRKFLGKFVKTSVISKNADVTKVPYDEHNNQLPDDLLAVGMKNREFLADFEDDIAIQTQTKFFRLVQVYFDVLIIYL